MLIKQKIRSSIGVKFSLSVFLRAGLLSLLIISSLALVEYSRTEQAFLERLNNLTMAALPPLQRAMFELDDDFAIKVSEGLLNHAEIAHITLIDDVGPRQIFSKTLNSPGNSLNSYIYALEPIKIRIEIGQYDSGTLIVKANAQHLDSLYFRELVYVLLSQLIILLVILFLVLNTFKEFISNPLHIITRDAKRIEQGERDVHIDVKDHADDELGTLSNAIENMASELIENAEQLEQRVKERTLQLEDTHKELAEAEKMKALGTLVAGVAHEVNTPLGSAVTVHSVIDESFKQLVSKISSASMTKTDLQNFLNTCEDALPMLDTNLQRAASLVRSFKQVAVDQSHDEQRELMLCEYIQTVLNSMHGQTKRGLDIKLSCPEDLKINSLPGVLAQLVTNLVMNSLIHAYEPQTKGDVTIDISLVNQHVIMIYRDYGKGIPEKDLTNIFEPFWTTKRGSGGSGLGLSILYNLTTQKLQGSIKVESDIDQGVTFTLTFPAILRQDPVTS